MPSKTSQSLLFSKLGSKFREAADVHRFDEVEISNFGRLPAGLEGGVARLTTVKFATVKEDAKKYAGEPFFYCDAVVVSPKMFNGQRVAGLRTQITEVICDKPERTQPKARKTVADALGFVQKQLKILGVTDPEMLSAENLESTVEALQQQANDPDNPIYIYFRTYTIEDKTPGPKTDNREPFVNHMWLGLATDYAPEDEGDGVQDDSHKPSGNGPAKTTGTRATSNGAGKPSTPVKTQGKVPAKPAAKAPPKEEPADAFDEYGDLDSLAEQATAGEQEAADRLTAMAVEAGMTQEEVDNAPDWPSVVERIQAGGEGGGDEDQGDQDEEVVPVMRGTYYLSVKNARTKKAEWHEVQVSKIDKTARTVSVLDNSAGKKPIPTVAWSELRNDIPDE